MLWHLHGQLKCFDFEQHQRQLPSKPNWKRSYVYFRSRYCTYCVQLQSFTPLIHSKASFHTVFRQSQEVFNKYNNKDNFEMLDYRNNNIRFFSPQRSRLIILTRDNSKWNCTYCARLVPGSRVMFGYASNYPFNYFQGLSAWRSEKTSTKLGYNQSWDF